jgi:integrase
MGRPAKIWKRRLDHFYYTTINGHQEKLSLDYEEAKEMFHQLQATHKKTQRTRVSTTLGELCNAFLDLAKQTKEQKTYENQLGYLQSFCDHVGKGKRARDITGKHLDDWSLATGWGTSTRTAARSTVIACFNFGVERRILIENPLKGVKRGTYENKERILTAAEKDKIRNAARGNFKDFLFVLEQTGARPFSEIGTLTAAMIDWEQGSVTFEKHKNKKKQKTRVLYLPPSIKGLLSGLSERHPHGTLFRTRDGFPWSRASASQALRLIENRAGISGITSYCFRHTYITDCLAKSMSPAIVAELVGNSVRTIMKYYNHLSQRKDTLRDAAKQAVDG